LVIERFALQGRHVVVSLDVLSADCGSGVSSATLAVFWIGPAACGRWRRLAIVRDVDAASAVRVHVTVAPE
jgi:hypothetical protein